MKPLGTKGIAQYVAKPHSNYIDQRKIGELTVSEFTRLLKNIQIENANEHPDTGVVQTNAISEELKNLATKVNSIEKALQQISPQEDPEESQYLTTEQAARMIGVSRQTVQHKKSRGLLEFYGEGRIQRTTVAAVKRYLKMFGNPLSQIKRAERSESKARKRRGANDPTTRSE